MIFDKNEKTEWKSKTQNSKFIYIYRCNENILIEADYCLISKVLSPEIKNQPNKCK